MAPCTPFAGMQGGSQQQAPVDPCVDALTGRESHGESHGSSDKLKPALTGRESHGESHGGAHGSSDKLKPVPDINGQRWCRACEAMLPVSAFPTGKRRYLCRQHLWRRCTRPCKERRLGETNHRHVCRLWRRCWEDAKLSFGQKGITLLQKHIARMLQDWKDGNQNVKSAANLDRSSDYVLKNFSDCAAIVPFDPGKVLSPANATVVDMPGRTALLRACKSGGNQAYVQALEQIVK